MPRLYRKSFTGPDGSITWSMDHSLPFGDADSEGSIYSILFLFIIIIASVHRKGLFSSSFVLKFKIQKMFKSVLVHFTLFTNKDW